ncbi:non-ribosomal peptide synthetase, partial [Photorhabdus sp. RW14-46]|uniref:non-ribosomal peptide synthetase n=1 Tax=Photorhabdus sp. RW14-46 TaxID=2100168 RepID=UPI0013F45F57
MKDNIAIEGNMFKSEALFQWLDGIIAHHINKTSIPSRKCVVVGGTPLAVSCAKQIQSAGHIIQAVLSTDSVLQTWAEQQGIDWVNSVDELQEYIRLQPVDWLFSIDNPIILPELLIQQIHGGVFNYHDSYAVSARETSEPFWYKRLITQQPAHLPFDIPHRTTEPRWITSPWQFAFPQGNFSQDDFLQGNSSQDYKDLKKVSWKTLLQAFVIYLARLNQQTMFQIGWCVGSNDDLSNVASVVPMTLEVVFDKPWCDVSDVVDNELAQHGTYSRDLFSHYPVLSTIPALKTRHPWPIAVSVMQDDRLCDQASAGELLTFQINTQGGFRWIYDENRLDMAVILRMNEHLQMLLSSKRTDDETPIGQLNLLPKAERTLLLETWNETETPYPEKLCIHQLFEQQVVKTPEATALVYEDQSFSYAELNAHANRLAHQLIELGVRPEQSVAIYMSRSPAMVIGILAILKAGGAYVPLDPNYPAERLAYMLEDAAPIVLLTQKQLPAQLTNKLVSRIPTVFYDLQEVETMPTDNPDAQAIGLSSHHLAYVIYTSGSTGLPKGVAIEHGNTVNFLFWAKQNFSAEELSHTLFATSLNFDLSVYECFAPLISGGTTYIVPDALSLATTEPKAHHLHPISLINTVPSAIAYLADSDAIPKTIRTINLAGEALKPYIVERLFASSPVQDICNLYGPSETTTYSIWTRMNRTTGFVAHIGRPIANTRIYILDTQGQPVPLGIPGEIYIAGQGVARGYLNQPELTAARFLTDPFSDKPHARMYRTGDLGRYRLDGNLEFLGRNDQQVKIRGFRIEPGEIESRLITHPAVRESVVLVRGDGLEKRLVVYVVADAAGGLVNQLQAYLSSVLPEFMVPAAFVRLDTFPLTPNGKLDRQALPAPGEEDVVRQIYEAPQGEAEIVLAAIWGELLDITQISRHDNFFTLGGHSLLAVRMIERLRQSEMTLAVRDLFQTPVLSDLAKTLGQHRAVDVPANVITPDITALTPMMLPLIDLTQADIDYLVKLMPGGLRNIQDIYALSPLQDGILFHHLLANEGDPYLLTGQMMFADRNLLDRYLAVMQQVVNRHDILRTAFVWQGLSMSAQVVLRQATLSVTELTLDPAEGPVGEQLSQRFDPRHFRLNLSEAPLLQFVIAQETEGRWCLLEIQHHLIGDHTTLEMMHHEAWVYLAGQEKTLPAPAPFRNLVAEAQLGVSPEAHTRFFTDMLADVTEPTLPFGMAEVHRDGSQVTEYQRMLTAELNHRLRHQARQLGVSLAALCHLAWAQVLSRTSDQEKVVFGTVLFGRMAAGEGADSGLGLFMNTLPLRLDIDDTPVRDSVQQTHTRLAELLAHEHASLALAQRCSGIDNASPLFSALLNYRHNDASALSDKWIDGIEFIGEQERTNYPFVLSVEDFGDSLGLTAQTVQPFAPERLCDYMQQALENLADALEHTPDRPVQSLDILPEAERTLLLRDWNATEAPYPDALCLHQLFEQQAEKSPAAIALVHENQTLSYAELNARANRLARQLIVQGVRPGEHVALLLERSVTLVVAQLAVLKASAVYVPVDPGMPNERQNWLISDCAAQLLLTNKQMEIPVDLAVPFFRIEIEEDETDAGREATGENLNLPRLSTDAVYVMYTSGSTGMPKGVVVSHRSVARLVINNGYADIGTDDRVAFTANPAFDASTFEVWAALLNGGRLVVIDHTTLLTPQALVRVLQLHRITILWLTIGLFNRLAVDLTPVFPQIKTLIFGGEVADLQVIANILNTHAPQQLLQAYGPTEGTTFTTMYPITALIPGAASIPLGRSIANTRVYLFDTKGQPVPLGAVGEIYVGGDGIAKGYLNRPDLTAERFLPDPYSNKPDARMYRTGDLARYRPDGNLEFMGRNDQQVKIRGFRIEPGEIEACLAEHPSVQGSVVLEEKQNKRLVAYVVAEEEEGLVSSLRDHLNARLPDYMVPAAFVCLDSLPLTRNGKLDRKALPEPDGKAFARQHYEAPQEGTEWVLATIWCELLGIEQVSRHDNFFALGGHSLLAVRMMERLRQSGLALAVRELFQTPVLSSLAQKLKQNQAVVVPANVIIPDTTELTPSMLPLIDLTQNDIDHIVGQVPGGVSNIQDIYALSPLQDGILFHHLLANEGDPYLLTDQMVFADRSLLDRYLAAMQQVVNRHDILRTAFVWQGLSVPAQVVWRQTTLSVTELTLDPAEGPIGEQLSQRFDPRHFRLNLSEAPLLQFVIAREADGRWCLLALQHHLIGDHTTQEVVYREVRAYLTEQAATLPASVPFRNLVAQARLGVSQEAHTRFFTDMLAAVTDPTLPFGLAEVHRDGSQIDESPKMLPAELNNRLRYQAQQLGVSLAALCHLAWAQVLSRTSGQKTVVFGTVLFGRMAMGEGADSGLGLFINTLPLRLDIDNTSVQESVQQAHTQLAGLLTHEHASLALAQQCSGIDNGSPLFSALLNYRHNDVSAISGELISGVEFVGSQERTNYPFVLSVEDFGDSLGLTAQVIQPFSPERLCDYMQQALESLADALEHTPDRPVQSLDILPEAERTLLLRDWNATETPYPDTLCLHQLFEQQAEKTPAATALVHENQTLSYAELNARANRLARQLIAQGVHPGGHVALLLERSVTLVVAQLAVLKAGAVYVPIDPGMPNERKSWLLSDCAAQLLMTNKQMEIPVDLAVPFFRIEDETDAGREATGENLNLPRLSTDAVYVMYTSGSTGMPKGVVVSHRAVVRLVINNGYADIGPDDRVAFTANPAFDASTFEVWAPLLNGGTLVVIDHVTLLTPQALVRVLQLHRITILWLTIGLFNRLAAELAPVFPQIKTLIFGGDIPDLHVIASILENKQPQQLLQAYGPTESTTFSTTYRITTLAADARNLSIGRPIANTCVYLLDMDGLPVPLGAIGEIYIGGDGVAKGYLNRPDLTAERFLLDPYSDKLGARMYRTGDLARYRLDGNLEFMGRNDQQVKIRGFRIEPREIENRLANHPVVRESAVLALGEGLEKRLVAYVVANAEEGLVNSLRTHLNSVLPEYMIPAAFVRLDSLPLTPNGKLDRRALPVPDEEAFARQIYEAPQGTIEMTLASVWCELLGIEKISRHDNFFTLGGHSLLAVRMMAHLRQLGLKLSVRDLFQTPVLSSLAQRLGQYRAVPVPACEITPKTTVLTPAMLPLIDLTQADIDRIVGQVPGGVSNIQDIYALSPLQDGILFHHLLANEGDPYLLTDQMVFADRALLDRYLAAMQQAVNRHDILRTAFVWQGLSVPAQVVWRQATLSVTEPVLDPADGPIGEQLIRRFSPHHYRLNLSEAPLLRFVIAQETDGRWVVVQLLHHLIGDHTTLDVLYREIQTYLAGQAATLTAPVPFRNLVAQARLDVSPEAHTRFFTDMLADVTEPTLPFGVSEVHRDGSQVTEHQRMLTTELNRRLRYQAQQLGISLAALCHLAWAQVLSCTSGQEKVVFGTVLFGRMAAGEGADSGLGLFINTLPLRLDIDNTPVRDSVQQAHTRLAELLAHEHASLALVQRCSSIDNATPLFSTLLNYRHNDASALSGAWINGIEFVGGQERTNYPFTLSVEDFGDSLGLTAQVVQPFAPERLCDYMQQALESLADALEHTPERRMRTLNILPEAERSLLISDRNATETPYPDTLCFHQLFEQQVEKTPTATALVHENQTLTYTELNARANRLAHQLIALGVGPDRLVAICVSRSPAMVIGMLAILKAGGAYVPLDPTYPSERLAYILTDTDPAIVLVNNTGKAALGQAQLTGRTVLDLNTSLDYPDSNPQIPALTSRNLAYVIYTSGSTGKPKGVMVEHRGLCSVISTQQEKLAIAPDSRTLQFASNSFDACVWECCLTLLAGASLYLPQPTDILLGAALTRYLADNRISHILFLPPTVLMAMNELPDTVKSLLVAGEACSATLVKRWAKGRQMFNAYGPTETTICATLYACDSQHKNAPPIGQPVANARIYLLNADGQPVPNGVTGEIYIGGVGVARGYLNRPDLTAERFLPDPYSDKPDARMYRTGDLARYQPDGNLEFMGRNDQQVKVRGFRIEPGEIEARLMEHPAMRESVVLAQRAGSEKRLVAYIVAEAEEGLVNSLREHLSAVLPAYMVPTAFMRLDALPLTPNGKLDRKALPAPDSEAFVHQHYEAPQGETEIALAAIWCDLLEVEQVSRHDNFFALGGHSLVAVRMMNRIMTVLGVELPLTALFNSPSLMALAQAVQLMVDKQALEKQDSTALPAITPVFREGILPLSFAQQRLWFLAQLEGISETYHIPLALHLRGRLDIAIWQQALNIIFARHEALRTVFISVDGQPQVRLLAADHGLPLVHHDLRGRSDIETALECLCAEEISAPFELSDGPLIRAVLIRLTEEDSQFLLIQHHIVSDGWSVTVLIRELNALYTAFLNGQSNPLPPLAIQYPDYAVWQHQWLSAERTQVQSDYWRSVLADAPVLLDLPTDRPRPPEQSFAGGSVSVRLDPELTAALKQLSQQHGVTLFMTLLSAWSIVLSRLSGQEDIIIGTPSAGRSRQEIEPLIGFFVNTLALRIIVPDELTVAECLTRVRESALAAQAHQDLPFEQVVEIVQPPRRLAHTPLFQVLFAWQNNEPMDWTVPELTVTLADQAFDFVRFDLELEMYEEADEIIGTLNYSTSLFDSSTVERHREYLQIVLQAMAVNAQQKVGEMNILPLAERRLLLESWNPTETPYPAALCIHQLFEQQAEKTPEAIALAYKDQT